MSGRTCLICGKGGMQARHISHANNKTKRKMQVNLRPLKMVIKGKTVTAKLCVKCLRDEREKIKNLKLSAQAEKIISASQAAQKEKTFG
jgi:ribosomal protein L28